MTLLFGVRFVVLTVSFSEKGARLTKTSRMANKYQMKMFYNVSVSVVVFHDI